MKAWLRRFLGTDSIVDHHEQLLEMHAAHALEMEKLKLAVADLREHLSLPPIVEVDERLNSLRIPHGDPQMGA